MVQSIVQRLASQWFGEHSRLAYWVARRWCRRLLDCRGADYSGEYLEALTQDAVCRGFDRFAKRCQRELCGLSDRKRWVCQCVMRGARDAVRCKSRFGSISSPVAVRDDAMNRCQRVYATMGPDGQPQDPLALVECSPVLQPVQRWELEVLVSAKLPDSLRQTALYAACGLTQEQSAILQRVTDRTVRNRLSQIRATLRPQSNAYAVICDALRQCLQRPFPVAAVSCD